MKQFLLLLRKYIGDNEKPVNGVVVAYFVRSAKLLVNSDHLFYQVLKKYFLKYLKK